MSEHVFVCMCICVFVCVWRREYKSMCMPMFSPLLETSFVYMRKVVCLFFLGASSVLFYFLPALHFTVCTTIIPTWVTWKYFFISFSFFFFYGTFSFIISACHALCSVLFITCSVTTCLLTLTTLLNTSFIPVTLFSTQSAGILRYSFFFSCHFLKIFLHSFLWVANWLF